MKTRAFFLALCLPLFACSLFSPAPTPTQTDILNGTKPNPLANTIPETTIVPTPTWEEILLDSSGGGIATPAPVARSDFPPPSVNPVIPLPPLAEVLSQPAGTINMLLLGSDARGPFGGQRTDTLLFVSFHPKRGEVTIISFPRDLYVYIPGWTVRRINEAYQYGGFAALADTFDYNFGVRPDYFVLVNFDAFEDVVDSMGGVDVQVNNALREGEYSVQPGAVHMNGEMALWYVRSRYSTSDFSRMQRQQEVLMAMFTRMVSLEALDKVPQMYALYEESVTTNVGLKEALAWVGVAKRMADTPDTLQTLTINQELVTPYTTPAGGQVLLPNTEDILTALNDLLIK